MGESVGISRQNTKIHAPNLSQSRYIWIMPRWEPYVTTGKTMRRPRAWRYMMRDEGYTKCKTCWYWYWEYCAHCHPRIPKPIPIEVCIVDQDTNEEIPLIRVQSQHTSCHHDRHDQLIDHTPPRKRGGAKC